MAKFKGFPSGTLRFLEDLQANNNRAWFAEHKERYESSFLEPALNFIRALEEPMAKAAPLLKVEAKKVGGSLMRIYKDTRFSKDKTPYKTNIGIHFRHRAGKDVHAPGIYFHIAPDECFLGAGIWRPPSAAVNAVRAFMAENPQAWKKVMADKRFRSNFSLYDDRLKTAPRGYAKDHVLIDDLRLKSFMGMAPLAKQTLGSEKILDTTIQLVGKARPLMAFLCEALEQPY